MPSSASCNLDKMCDWNEREKTRVVTGGSIQSQLHRNLEALLRPVKGCFEECLSTGNMFSTSENTVRTIVLTDESCGHHRSPALQLTKH